MCNDGTKRIYIFHRMVKQALKSSSQVTLICFAEFTLFLLTGLQGLAFWLTTNRTLWWPKCGVNFYIRNHASISKLLYQSMPSQALQIKGKISEIKKAIKWLQKVRALGWESTGYAWNEYCQNYQAGHIALLFPHVSPARCCVMSTAWVNPHRNLLKWKTDSAWATVNAVLSLEIRMGLWPGWG